MIYYLLVVFSVLAAAGAQMLLKQGAKKQYASFWRQYLNPWVIGGYGIMGASLLLNIFCLSHGVQVKEVSIIESLSYLFVPLLAWLFFREKITLRKAGAIAVIMAGMLVFFSK
jgi:drug/metabolite transporter (DMT)-like permease